MKRATAIAGQVLLYAALAAVIAVFSRWPVYQHLPPDTAVIKLSLSHHGERLEACVELSLEELAKLPPNMRAPTRCPRERSPVTVELSVDGELVHRESAAPSGLSRDGAASIYQRLEVPAGRHRIGLRLMDSVREPERVLSREAEIELATAQILVIDFDAAKQEILFR
jgi:hypothetical protein